MLRYRLPDGRSWKRLWEGWVGSFTMLLVFAGASCKENVQDGWERGTDDLSSRVHCPLEGLAVSSTAVPVPDSDAAGQHTLDGAPVECVEDGWWETCSFSRRRKCRRCCAFLESDMVLVVQVRSSVMCTPRNLVLLTLSTVELSMVSGGWSTEFSPEVHHNLLCLLHIEGQIVNATTTQPAVPLPLCSAFHRCC